VYCLVCIGDLVNGQTTLKLVARAERDPETQPRLKLDKRRERDVHVGFDNLVLERIKMDGDAVGSRHAGTDVEHMLDDRRRVNNVEEVVLERDGITIGVYGECRCVRGYRWRKAEPLPVILQPIGNIVVDVKTVGVEAKFPQTKNHAASTTAKIEDPGARFYHDEKPVYEQDKIESIIPAIRETDQPGIARVVHGNTLLDNAAGSGITSMALASRCCGAGTLRQPYAVHWLTQTKTSRRPG
jgi:hypothetical protein